jgi:hypothetical protein
MIGSQIAINDIILSLYRDIRTDFRLKEIAILSSETDFLSLDKKKSGLTVH